MCDVDAHPGAAGAHEQLQRLPRNAAYRYEFIHGQAYHATSKHYHALLELTPMTEEMPEASVRSVRGLTGESCRGVRGRIQTVQPSVA
jgi:hypothetical protein